MVQVASTILHNNPQATLHSKALLKFNHKDSKFPMSKSHPRRRHSNLLLTLTLNLRLKQDTAILHNSQVMHHLRRLLHRTARHQLHRITFRTGRLGKHRVHRPLVLMRDFTGRIGRGLVWADWETVHMAMDGAGFLAHFIVTRICGTKALLFMHQLLARDIPVPDVKAYSLSHLRKA
jgi:hypothetical protein